MVKNLLAMQESQEMHVWFLNLEDSLEEGMATHFSILSWRMLWTEEPGGLQSIGLQRIWHDWSDLACMHACNSMVTLKMETVTLPQKNIHNKKHNKIEKSWKIIDIYFNYHSSPEDNNRILHFLSPQVTC